MGYIV